MQQHTLAGEQREAPSDTAIIWHLGEQFITFSTTDSPDTVRAWYDAQLSARGWYRGSARMQPPCYVFVFGTNPVADGTTNVALKVEWRDARADTYSPPCH